MELSSIEIWLIIIVVGIGTFLIRYSFIGLIGNREIPPWLLRHLRYTPVAVIPGLVAPLVLWPEATGGEPDPVRLSAAAVAFAVGYFTKNIILSMLGGAGTLYTMLYLTGQF